MALIGYTLAPQWWMMVLLGVFAGLGAGAIDAGLNTYVAANFGVDLSIAPIFPAMISGTKTRVGDRYAANTIGMQMAATGFGTAVIPSLMGVLARQISLEVIPVCLLATYAGLSGFYVLAMGHWKKQAVTNLEQLYENPS